jgi:hypothetical protein
MRRIIFIFLFYFLPLFQAAAQPDNPGTPTYAGPITLINPVSVSNKFKTQVLAVLRNYLPNLTIIGPQTVAMVSMDEWNAIEAVLLEQNLIQVARPPEKSKLLTSAFRFQVITALSSFGMINQGIPSPSPNLAAATGATGSTGFTGATGAIGPQGWNAFPDPPPPNNPVFYSFQLNFSTAGNAFAQSATNVPAGWTVSGFNTNQITVTHNAGSPISKIIFWGCDTSVSPSVLSITYPTSVAPTQFSSTTMHTQFKLTLTASQVKADSSTGTGFVIVYCWFYWDWLP